LKDDEEAKNKYVISIEEVHLYVPAKIGDYTDFYSSKFHAFNVGSILRGPANALN
jgi:fumarylacetoacetase